MNPRHIAQSIIRFGSTLLAHTRGWQSRLEPHLDSDRKWIILILLLATLLRFPMLQYPAETVFDEPIYSDFAMLSLQAHPFFDIHPPLARILFTEIVARTDYDPSTATIITTPDFAPHAFLDFPYIPLRTTVAFFGTLLPLLLYGISRLLGATPRWAGLVALFVVIDPAFIVYSRAILPDTILLAVEMGALLAALAAVQSETTRGKVGFALLAALALGAAVSIKWIALSIVGVVGLLYLFHRRWKTILATGVVMAGVYVFVFASFVLYFPNGGKADPVLLTYDVPYVTTLEFPADPTWGTAVRFLPELHRTMWRANTDPETSARLPETPTALSWPVAKVSMLGWWSGVEQSIMLKGNTLLYPVTFFLFLFEIGWIIARYRTTKHWPVGIMETTLVIGYFGNYLPFFLIERSMFLYHYFSAFLLLLLLIPFVVPRVIACLAQVTRDELFAKVFALVVVLLVLIDVLRAAPQIYGF